MQIKKDYAPHNIIVEEINIKGGLNKAGDPDNPVGSVVALFCS